MSLSFKPSEYLVVMSELEASELLREKGERARVIAGGTGIYEVAHQGLFSDVERLVDISRLKLNYIHRESDVLRLGACATMTSIFETEELSKLPELGALYDALVAIQPLQVKNVATVGGAICTALPFFDLPVALAALDSTVVLAPHSRSLNLLEFIQGYFAVDLKPGEFVREVLIPLNRGLTMTSSFQKFALTGDDWSIVNCGCRLNIDDNDKILEVRLCFGGGVGEKPVRALEVERQLMGMSCNDQEKVSKVLEEYLPKELETITDLKASAKYRIHLAKVLARRAVRQAAELANGVTS